MLKKASSPAELSEEVHRNLGKAKKLLEENFKLIKEGDFEGNKKVASILRDHRVLLTVLSQIKKIRYDTVDEQTVRKTPVSKKKQ
jgi:hypothetical protein